LHPRRNVVTIHDLGYLAFPQAHTARRRMELHLTTRWSAHAASQVIAISQATKDDLVHHYSVNPDKVSVVHHGLSPQFHPVEDPAVRAAVQRRYGISSPYLLYVGTVQPRKNLARLLAAFGQLLAIGDLRSEIGDQGTNLTLVIAGKKGWLTEEIEGQAARAGLGQRVHFTGYVADDDLPALLSGALAFVFPSLYEGFGMPVLEAMACGTPVLTSTTTSLPEVAADAALLVDPTDTDAIARGLARLVAEPALRSELRQRGLARAAQFTWARCAAETLAVLRDVASR
ncbi:MAG: glycosyltransferase family 4 protein, partial [Chloroflexaceae bacterium]|nr:glycosyltransferase family 4 protein [Chloroflexaceae bacterium]